MSGSAATSATGGYINPLYSTRHSADTVQAALQTMAARLSQLPDDMVRPRWQPTPPVQPPAEASWAAIGVIQVDTDDYPVFRHVGNKALKGLPPGFDISQRHMTLTVMVSFYGPDAEDRAGLFRDNLYVTQNYEPVRQLGLKLRTVHDLARTPELVNTQFINRVDLRIEYRMQENRVYPVLDLDGADVTITESDRPIVVNVSARGMTWDDNETQWEDGGPVFWDR